jgi:PAS domain S-box-containing protein
MTTNDSASGGAESASGAQTAEQVSSGLPSALHKLTDLRGMLDNVSAGIRSQDALLRMRQLSLPQNVLNQLIQVEHDLSSLQHALVEDETELTQLRALVEMSAMINSSLDVDAVLAQAMDVVITLTEAERGFILLTNESTGELEYRVARGVEPSEQGYEVSRTILNDVITTGKALLTDNASVDPNLQESETVARFVLRSVLCVPLVYKDLIIGAVYVDNRYREGVFTDRELSLLTAFANQTAIAIENALLYTRVQQQLEEISRVNELLENIFASIASGVITTDNENAITLYNNAAEALFNLARQDAIGTPISQVLPDLDDLVLSQVREQAQSAALELETNLSGRGRRLLGIKLTPLQNARQETQGGAALVLDDLTEQRARAAALQNMRVFMPPGMVENIDQIANLALGGERREITCVFIYVCSYSVFPRDMRPQSQMETLNTYLEVATGTIFRADGVIDKYMGNEIMVLFNTQLNPQTDHALRAVQMALALRNDFRALYHQFGIAPEVDYYRIGIHTGIATLGNVGSTNRRSFTAIGDTVNLAKRLEENATDGQIIVSEETVSAISAANPPMRFDELGTIQVKGRQQFTRVFEVFES